MGAGLSKKAKQAVKNCKLDGGVELILEDCNIGRIRNFKPILKFPNLKTLNLRRNVIDALPEKLDKLLHLLHINLSDNQLTRLPDAVLVLVNLQVFDLSRNKLVELPSPIGRMAGLRELNISFNQIKVLPADFGTLSLTKLDYAGAKLKVIPKEVWAIQTLEEVNVSRNQLTVFRESFVNFVMLTKLDMSENQLEELNPCVGLLERLEELSLEANILTELPVELCRCTNLRVLNVNRNKLTTLDNLHPELASLSSLVELRAAENQLKALPPSIAGCTGLRVLDLTKNALKVLPKEVGWHGKTMRVLWLADNQLSDLPGDLAYLNPAIDLNLDRNPLRPVYSMAYQQGTPPLLDALRGRILAYPAHCVAFGDALALGRAGTGLSFDIKAFDKKKKPVTSAEDSFEVEMVRVPDEDFEEPVVEEPIVKNNRDGTHTVFYNVKRSGMYKVHINNGGTPIGSEDVGTMSPFDVYIEPNEPDPSNSTLAGDGLHDCKAGSTLSFMIQTRDHYMNKMDRGGMPLEVTVMGGSNPGATIEDYDDGTYKVTYSVGWAADYVVYVSSSGLSLPGSPYKVVVTNE